jgi:hypothetical protein
MATLLIAGLAGALSTGAKSADALTGDAIRRAFEGNTVSGRYSNRQFFTEFHHPDGRALGHNGWQVNKDACWTTTETSVCYYYGPQNERTTHCFSVELVDRLYVLKTAETGRINAVATVEPGNPRNHTDNGVSWYCDGNISGLPPGGRRVASMTPRPQAGSQASPQASPQAGSRAAGR